MSGIARWIESGDIFAIHRDNRLQKSLDKCLCRCSAFNAGQHAGIFLQTFSASCENTKAREYLLLGGIAKGQSQSLHSRPFFVGISGNKIGLPKPG